MDGESLRRICADRDMPDKSQVFRWLSQNETFRDQYARAREIQVEALVDEITPVWVNGQFKFGAMDDAIREVSPEAAEAQAQMFFDDLIAPYLDGNVTQHQRQG
jgi:hypothetical protein